MEKATRQYLQTDSRGTVRVEMEFIYGEPLEAAELRDLLPLDDGRDPPGTPGYADEFMRRHADALAEPRPTDITIRVSIQAPSEDKPRTIELSASEFHTFVKSVRRALPDMDTGGILGMPRRPGRLRKLAVAGH